MINFIAGFRDLKIKLIDNPNLFRVDEHNVKKNKEELRIIKKKAPNGIITGSLALSLYGLIDRSANDIDILVDYNDRRNFYKIVSKNIYGELILANRIGSTKFKVWKFPFSVKTYILDIFKITGEEKFQEFNFEGHQFKIQNPLEIIQVKMQLSEKHNLEYSSYKHQRDLNEIFH